MWQNRFLLVFRVYQRMNCLFYLYRELHLFFKYWLYNCLDMVKTVVQETLSVEKRVIAHRF